MKKLSKSIKVSLVYYAFFSASILNAGDFYFSQEEQVIGASTGVSSLTLTQSGGVLGNAIGNSADRALIVGSIKVLSLSQLSSSDTGGSNSTNFELHGADANTNAQLIINVDGSANNVSLNVGSTADVTRFVNPAVSINILGSGNLLQEVIANGSGQLSYTAALTGKDNIIRTTTGSNIENLTVNYDITGDDNELLVTTGSNKGNKDISAIIVGSNNNWTLMAKSTAMSNIDINQTGTDSTQVIGSVVLSGINNDFTLSLDKVSPGRFYMTGYGFANDTTSNLNITSNGAGSFYLLQITDDAVANLTLDVGVSGSATIRQ